MKCPVSGFEALAEIYGWFSDTSAGGLRSAGGFDTRDLKEAKALLEELAQGMC